MRGSNVLVIWPPVVAVVPLVPPIVPGRYRLVWFRMLYSSVRNSTFRLSTGVENFLFSERSVWLNGVFRNGLRPRLPKGLSPAALAGSAKAAGFVYWIYPVDAICVFRIFGTPGMIFGRYSFAPR